MNSHSSSPDQSALYALIEQLSQLPVHNPDRFETIDGYDNPTCTNWMRANFTIKPLAIYQEACHMNDETEVAVVDLISDLMHLVHSLDCNPKDVLEAALANFVAEAG